MTRTTSPHASRSALLVAWVVGVLIGIVVALATSDVVLGVIAGAPCVFIGVNLVRLWAGETPARPRHP